MGIINYLIGKNVLHYSLADHAAKEISISFIYIIHSSNNNILLSYFKFFMFLLHQVPLYSENQNYVTYDSKIGFAYTIDRYGSIHEPPRNYTCKFSRGPYEQSASLNLLIQSMYQFILYTVIATTKLATYMPIIKLIKKLIIKKMVLTT